MTHPIPPGARDILPEEMRELRALQRRLAEVFESFGYGEVATPTVEYDAVLSLGDARGAPVAHRFFDESGQLVAMRSDMTVPIARLVADRYAEDEPPFRLFYNARAFRAVRPQRGQAREFFQAGIELVGVPGAEGTAEVVEVLSSALDAAGLGRAVIGLGHAALYRDLLREVGVAGKDAEAVLDRLAAHDLVGLEEELEGLSLGEAERRMLATIPTLRGGPECLERARELGEPVVKATERLASAYAALVDRGVADRVMLDLGLLRDLGYYTGTIVEVYDPALGHILGGGGRYDELMARFGRPLPAVGFALYLERVHIAKIEEERLAREGVER